MNETISEAVVGGSPRLLELPLEVRERVSDVYASTIPGVRRRCSITYSPLSRSTSS